MKQILLILSLLLLSVGFVSANIAPFVTLTVEDTGDNIDINAVAYDEPLLNSNPGIEWIKIYENGNLISENLYSCSEGNPMICTLTRNYPSGTSVVYYAEAEDITGVIGRSEDKTVSLVPIEILNLEVTDITETSARIQWDTNFAATSVVRYGTESDVYDFVVEDDTYVTSHDVLLSNLQDGETYYFIAESVGVNGNFGESGEETFAPGKLVISFVEPDDGDEFELGDKIEGELRVENIDNIDVDVSVRVVLYDDSENKEIASVEFDKNIDSKEKEDFEFEIKLPYELDEGNDWELLAEVEVDGIEYKHRIDIDLDRKDHDVIIDDIKVFVEDKVEVSVGILNRGGKLEEDIYVELRVYGLGITEISERFSLTKYGETDSRVNEMFSFEKPEMGVYTLEASLFYGSKSIYEIKDFEVIFEEEVAENEGSELLSGNIGASVEIDEEDILSMRNITLGIADFLLLVVVIYGILWLIKK